MNTPNPYQNAPYAVAAPVPESGMSTGTKALLVLGGLAAVAVVFSFMASSEEAEDEAAAAATPGVASPVSVIVVGK
jgi:hypothetical protein